jgi:hypothetical protein
MIPELNEDDVLVNWILQSPEDGPIFSKREYLRAIRRLVFLLTSLERVSNNP